MAINDVQSWYSKIINKNNICYIRDRPLFLASLFTSFYLIIVRNKLICSQFAVMQSQHNVSPQFWSIENNIVSTAHNIVMSCSPIYTSDLLLLHSSKGLVVSLTRYLGHFHQWEFTGGDVLFLWLPAVYDTLHTNLDLSGLL